MIQTYLTLEETAKVLNLAPKTLRNWKYSDPKRLPPHKVIRSGSRELLRFDPRELERWMDEAR